MHFLTDGMAGSVHEILPVPCVLNHPAADIIHFPPIGAFTGSYTTLHKGDGRIPSPSNNLKNVLVPGRHSRPDEPRPGDIRIDRPWSRLFSPQVDQYKVTLPNRG